jgi:hypothetical protein
MKFYFFSIPPAEGQTTSSSRKESAPRLAPCTPPVWGAHPRRPAPPSTRPLGERPAVRTSAPHLPHPPPLSPHIMPKRPACAHANALQRLPYADCRFRGSVRLARRTVPAAPHPPPTARMWSAPTPPRNVGDLLPICPGPRYSPRRFKVPASLRRLPSANRPLWGVCVGKQKRTPLRRG